MPPHTQKVSSACQKKSSRTYRPYFVGGGMLCVAVSCAPIIAAAAGQQVTMEKMDTIMIRSLGREEKKNKNNSHPMYLAVFSKQWAGFWALLCQLPIAGRAASSFRTGRWSCLASPAHQQFAKSAPSSRLCHGRAKVSGCRQGTCALHFRRRLLLHWLCLACYYGRPFIKEGRVHGRPGRGAGWFALRRPRTPQEGAAGQTIEILNKKCLHRSTVVTLSTPFSSQNRC